MSAQRCGLVICPNQSGVHLVLHLADDGRSGMVAIASAAETACVPI